MPETTNSVPQYEISLENGQRIRPTVPTSFEYFSADLLAKYRTNDGYPYITVSVGENTVDIHIDSIACYVRLTDESYGYEYEFEYEHNPKD